MPIFTEFIYPTELTQPKIIYAVSQQSSTRDEHSKPKMVPRHHTNPNKPKLVTPSAPSIETEPISLELFNRAVADLDTKGAIKLAKYRKFLSKQK